MTDQNQTLREDIAFMRGLAEQGRQAPLLGGSILLAAGLIFGTASGVVWLAAEGARQGMLVSNSLIYPGVFIGSGVIFGLTLWALLRRMRRSAGYNAATNKAAGLAWSGVGWAIFVIVVALMTAGARSGDWFIMSALPPVVFALYGTAYMVAAGLTRSRWLWGVTAGSFAMAVALGWFATDAMALYGLYTIAIFALVALPGYLLMRQARQAG